MLTLEERERRAYIEGRVEEAQLLGELTDAINYERPDQSETGDA